MALALSQSANSATLAAMQFGSLTLPSNLFLSPLAGYTNLPFRLVVRSSTPARCSKKIPGRSS
jgi:hypothetical protein